MTERRGAERGQVVLTKREIFMDQPIPQEVERVLKKVRELGMGKMFALHRLSGITLEEDSDFPEWKIRPNRWYWKEIKKRTLDKDASKLPDTFLLVDTIRRPDYGNDGKQLHENDFLFPLLAKLRKEKKIPILQNIPQTSRFGISPDELESIVFPEFATLIGADKAMAMVRLPRAVELNILGNLAYPHFGQADTSEWFYDKFGHDDRLFGGDSGFGGLAQVRPYWSGHRSDDIAFRLLIVFSPKA